MKPNLRQTARDIADFGALAMLALVAGFAINSLREKPLPFVYHSKADRLERAVETIARETKPVPSPATGSVPQATAEIISLKQFQQWAERGEAVILDARTEVLYRLGHVPAALNLPRDNFEAAHAKLRIVLEKHDGRPLVVYCSDADCEDSTLVADALLRLGYRPVCRFKNGWADWTNAQLPEQKGRP